MARAEVTVDSNVPAYARDVEAGVRRALAEAGKIASAAARSADTKGYRIHGIVAQTTSTAVKEDSRSWMVGLANPDYRAVFFDLGTLGRRTRKTKRPRQQPTTTAAGKKRGIRPVRFLATGRKAGGNVLLDFIRRELP